MQSDGVVRYEIEGCNPFSVHCENGFLFLSKLISVTEFDNIFFLLASNLLTAVLHRRKTIQIQPIFPALAVSYKPSALGGSQ